VEEVEEEEEEECTSSAKANVVVIGTEKGSWLSVEEREEVSASVVTVNPHSIADGAASSAAVNCSVMTITTPSVNTGARLRTLTLTVGSLH
jgi:hypothetical protein